MGKSKESGTGGEHSTAKRAAVAGAGALGVAAAVTVAKILHDRKQRSSESMRHSRKRRLMEFSGYGSKPEEQEAIARADAFDDDMSDSARSLMGKIAVLTQRAAVDTTNTVPELILRESLTPGFEEDEYDFAVTKLKENGLITSGTESLKDGSEYVTLSATPALVRAIEDGKYQALIDAEFAIINQPWS